MGKAGGTRRQFLARSAGLGVGAAGLAAFGPSFAEPVAALEGGRRVLIEDLLEPRAVMAARIGAARGGLETTLQARAPFTHVGVHWRGPVDVPAEIQTSTDGLSWTAWRRLLVERTPGEVPGIGEVFAALVGAPRHRFVRVRFAAGADRIGDVTATCLNSLDGPRLSPVLGMAQTLQARLGASRAWADGADFRAGIRTREQWEADESLRFGASGRELWERAYVAPRMVVVHHTATDNTYADAEAEVRAIYAYHAITQGFGDIGYQALIDREGRIYEGRRGRDEDPFGRLPREVLSFGVVAGHAFDYNYGSLGIALLGNFEEESPSGPQLERLEDLLAFEHARHQIDPRGRLDFARATRLWRYDLPALAGHRDCNNTLCPGTNLYPRLSELRERVAERLDAGPLPLATITETPATRNVWLGEAAYAWAGRAPFDRVFEGFQRELGQDPADHLLGYDSRGLPEHVMTNQREATFTLPAAGQYTLHLRPNGSPFADRHTVLADEHVVADNADEEGIERVGEWFRSRNVLEFYGANYEVAEADAEALFAWTLEVPVGGTYIVQACWAAASDRSASAPYTFRALGGVARTSYADQTKNGGVWVNLGELALGEGQTVRVELRAASDGVVIADAVRLLRTGV